MRHRPIVLIALLAALSTPVRADRAAGDACAAGLPPPSQQIYSATVASKPAPAAARGIVVAETKRMVRAGVLSPMKARSAAEAAGRCLALITK
jgi:hypothetical protein